jgi:hypothetical protein
MTIDQLTQDLNEKQSVFQQEMASMENQNKVDGNKSSMKITIDYLCISIEILTDCNIKQAELEQSLLQMTDHLHVSEMNARVDSR